MKGYAVKEIFLTLQGEGAHSGRAAVFCRFAGCNLWSGREPDRATAACRFCDTDFVGTNGTGGGRYGSAVALADAIEEGWAAGSDHRLCVLTGGEPMLQVDGPLVEALHARFFEIAVETNGTLDVPVGLDWVCVSPKAGCGLRLRAGDELKLVYPQEGCEPSDFESLRFGRLSLQPMAGPNAVANAAAAAEYCMLNPAWRLSVQTHKLIGLR